MRDVKLTASVSNDLDFALKMVFVRYELKTEGRSVPWDKSDDAFFIADGGWEPGESLDTEMLSGRTFGFAILKSQMEKHPEATLEISVVSATKADDTRIPSVAELSDRERREYEELKMELGI